MKSNINVPQQLSKMAAITKIRYSILFCSLATMASGQVAIGKTTVNGNSTILDFHYDYEDISQKGLILSSVDQEPVFAITPGVSSPNNGTFVFDRATKKVKMFENNQWVEMTDEGDSSQADAHANTSDETTYNQGAIIGASASEAIGVLVLESSDKAMILPYTIDTYSVKSPYPGTMVYDIDYSDDGNTGRIAIFDGANWNFWGIPEDLKEPPAP